MQPPVTITVNRRTTQISHTPRHDDNDDDDDGGHSGYMKRASDYRDTMIRRFLRDPVKVTAIAAGVLVW